MTTDKERLDWLGERGCEGVICDDDSRWAVPNSGIQNVPDPDEATDIAISFFVEKHEWKGTIREAIDYAMEQEKQESL